jgi:hypothetical protein
MSSSSTSIGEYMFVPVYISSNCYGFSVVKCKKICTGYNRKNYNKIYLLKSKQWRSYHALHCFDQKHSIDDIDVLKHYYSRVGHGWLLTADHKPNNTDVSRCHDTHIICYGFLTYT